jgi:glycosyltransferase involved in cell wall biosynthesis
MHGIFIQEHAKAAQLFDDVHVIHIIESPEKLKISWQLFIEQDQNITQNIPTYRLLISQPTFRRNIFLFFILRTFQAFHKMYVAGYHPDILHAHTYRAGFIAVILGKLYNIPVVISEHNSAFPRRLLSRNNIILARLALQNADLVLLVSRFLQKSIEEYGIHANFYICPNVVDTSIFYPPNQSSTNAALIKRLLFVGRLEPIKGLDDLLLAISSFLSARFDWYLRVVGEGPLKQHYEFIIEELGLIDRVRFFGYQSKPTLSQMMRESDVLILPSHIETFSAVAAEALACGLPVLATRCGGPEEYILPEVGRLVPISDPNSLGFELLSMLDHLDVYKRDQIAYYASTHFCLATVGSTLHRVYTNLND